MRHRIFGRTGESISEIGLGTWTMGGMWGPRDDCEAIQAMVRAIELGVNFFDTALVYGQGHSESLVASAIKEARAKVFVATKIPPLNHRWPASHEVPVAETFPPDHIMQCTEQSLKNLRQDCVDLQQLHVWSDNWLFDTGWLSAVEQLKAQGKVRYFGVSINDHQPDSALKIVESGLIDSVQVIFNIFDQSPLEHLFPLCEKHHVAVIVRCPFDEGSLAGTLSPETSFHKKDWRSHYFTRERLQETCERVQGLQFLHEGDIGGMARAALRYCLSYTAVSTVIPGMRRVAHVEPNCAVSDGRPFDAGTLEKLKKHAWPRNFYPFQ